jgi:cell division protein FtsW (lipid II flippase)
MARLNDICKTNMSLALALVGFDMAVIAVLLMREAQWHWTSEAAGTLLVVSVFSLTFSFFVYHAVLATAEDAKNKSDAERLVQKGNLWVGIGLFSLVLTVPLLMWEGRHFVPFGVSLLGFMWIAYHFLRREV